MITHKAFPDIPLEPVDDEFVTVRANADLYLKSVTLT